MINPSIGKYIRQYREAKHMTQEALAEKAGLSVTYIGMIERGEKLPKLETFVSIANSLEVSSDMLLSDVLTTGYEVKNSLLAEKLNNINADDRELIYDVVDVMLKHSKLKKRVKKLRWHKDHDENRSSDEKRVYFLRYFTLMTYCQPYLHLKSGF